jgi:hypothetical protein
MNPARLFLPSTYAEAVNEAAELAQLIRDLPRHVDSLAVSAARLAEAAETLAAAVEPLMLLQEQLAGPLGLVGDRVRKSRAAMTELRTAATPGRRRKPPGETDTAPSPPAAP